MVGQPAGEKGRRGEGCPGRSTASSSNSASAASRQAEPPHFTAGSPAAGDRLPGALCCMLMGGSCKVVCGPRPQVRVCGSPPKPLGLPCLLNQDTQLSKSCPGDAPPQQARNQEHVFLAKRLPGAPGAAGPAGEGDASASGSRMCAHPLHRWKR